MSHEAHPVADDSGHEFNNTREPLFDATAKHCNNMVARMIIDTIIRLGISVTAFRIVSPNRGWGLTAHDPKTGELWNIRTDEALDAACELALAIGLESRGTAPGCRLADLLN